MAEKKKVKVPFLLNRKFIKLTLNRNPLSGMCCFLFPMNTVHIS